MTTEVKLENPAPDLEARIEALERARPAHDFNLDYNLKLYEAFRTRVQHEDGLLNQRINFLLSSNAFLLAPYVLSHTVDRSRILNTQALDNLQAIIPIIGVAACLVAFAGAGAAVHSIHQVRISYEELCENEKAPPILPGIESKPFIHLAGLIPAFGFIVILLLVWLSFIFNVDELKTMATNFSFNLIFVMGWIVLILFFFYFVKWYIRRKRSGKNLGR